MIIIGKDTASVTIRRLKFAFTPCSLSTKNTTVTPRAIIVLMGSDRGRDNLAAVCVNLCGKTGLGCCGGVLIRALTMFMGAKGCSSRLLLVRGVQRCPLISTRKGAEITTTIPAPQCRNQKELLDTLRQTALILLWSKANNGARTSRQPPNISQPPHVCKRLLGHRNSKKPGDK